MKTDTPFQEIQMTHIDSEKIEKSSVKSSRSLRPMKSVTRAKSLRPEQTAVVARMRKRQVKLN